MNIVGEEVVIVKASDPTKKGATGTVVLETANTILLESKSKRIRVEKKGTDLKLLGSHEVLEGVRIVGRIEDRLRAGKL
jgi:RNase P/RNase MRP subunit p29